MNNKDLCPCNSGILYQYCCEPFITGNKIVTTAEALMRSRYTAYFIKDEKYLLKTWHPETRPLTIDFDVISGWCGLDILSSESGGNEDNQGVVEFRAKAIIQKKILYLHEISRFVKEDDNWLYVDGDIQESSPVNMYKVGRNDPCPCGSSKKFKKCCGV